MILSEMVIRSKLIPPQPNQTIFHRGRLKDQLSKSYDYPLTLIHAGTGFGKTTALIELNGYYNRVHWYHITEPDRDPTLFLAHLISAFLPGTEYLLTRLEEGGISATRSVLNGLINHITTDLEEEAILVLDDYHLVSDVTEINRWLEQLVEHRPPYLHFAIGCRQIPDTPAFIRWRVKGMVLTITQVDLSFNLEEIFDLFSTHYQFPITRDQAQALYTYTDGWIIALQMVWQRLQNSRSKRLDNILSELPTALSDIFNFLAHEVLMRQVQPIQEFLLSTSILHQMDAEVCNHLLERSDGQVILQQLFDRGLFITTADSIHYRYQRLFQDFLLSRLNEDVNETRQLHHQAANYYIGLQEYEEAIYHLFASGDQSAAAQLINSIGRKLLEIGWYKTLIQWIEQLDHPSLSRYPGLYLMQGDAYRLSSNFEEALTCYGKAEDIYIQTHDLLGRSLALRSKAQVFLDTIRPIKASSLLEEAISLLEPQVYPVYMADLLDLLAENKLNLGKPDEAQALHKEANMLRAESIPDDIYLQSRSLLRTGRLQEASRLIEASGALSEDPITQRPQRFHREMPLLLSLIHSMMGNVKESDQYARQGIAIGHQLDAPFVEAVGFMRLGHAYQLSAFTPWRKNRMERARECYEKSIELVKPFNVMRVQVEPLWGLCRYHGYQGNLTDAYRYAIQSIEIAETSGDHWFAALIKTTMGTSYVLAGDFDQAKEWLQKARDGFVRVGDDFGQAATECAEIANEWKTGQKDQALFSLARIVPRLQSHHFEFLITRPTYLGMEDPQIYLPLLLEAQKQGISTEWITQFLRDYNLSGNDFHPGYGLKIRCLGPLEVWRGRDLINLKDWQRDKARQLFQFFIAGRGRWFSRDQILEALWPEMDPDSAAQNFKVALNALNRALEPGRETGKRPFFVVRKDNLYGLNPSAQIFVDVDDFATWCQSTEEEEIIDALAIYRGDYLIDYLDDHSVDLVRDQIRDSYLDAAIRLADRYYQHSRWDAVIKICHDILVQDSCNEQAFQFLMRSHAARGNRSAVHAVYQRYCAVLRQDLDVPPSPDTTRLWQQLTDQTRPEADFH